MNRRHFVKSAFLGIAPLTIAGKAPHSRPSLPSPAPFEFHEWTLADFRKVLDSGRLTAVDVVKKYLERIDMVDRQGPALNSVIELNPDAIAVARALDRELNSVGPRGPLHGIPVLIKDNIATRDRMKTTAGSLALLESVAKADAFLVQQLRAAGAVLLGKTNLSEWANFRSSRSTSGWSGRGGLTKNPYVLDRNPSGSSSGSAVAVAANLCPLAVGTETDGSIVSPSSVNGVVGIKPTLGLVSRSGIVPIAHSQDTAGPMARTVTDAALLLNALVGRDPNDPITNACRAESDYTRFLDTKGLQGARLGVCRKFFDLTPEAGRVAESALNVLREQGATLIDPADVPSYGKFGNVEMEVLLYEFKADLNKYLADLEPGRGVKTLAEIIEFNESHRREEMPFFGQEILSQAQNKGPLSEPAYLKALEDCRRLAREEGIDAIMNQHQLDALVAPTTGPAGVTDLVYGDRDVGGSSEPAAVAGYPSITVPAGFVAGLPMGLSFFGRASSEGLLLRLAFAFEQASRLRRAPAFWESLDPGRLTAHPG